MNLSPGQLAEFDDLGFLFLPGCFSEEEVVVVLRAEADDALPKYAP